MNDDIGKMCSELAGANRLLFSTFKFKTMPVMARDRIEAAIVKIDSVLDFISPEAAARIKEDTAERARILGICESGQSHTPQA